MNTGKAGPYRPMAFSMVIMILLSGVPLEVYVRLCEPGDTHDKTDSCASSCLLMIDGNHAYFRARIAQFWDDIRACLSLKRVQVRYCWCLEPVVRSHL